MLIYLIDIFLAIGILFRYPPILFSRIFLIFNEIGYSIPGRLDFPNTKFNFGYVIPTFEAYEIFTPTGKIIVPYNVSASRSRVLIQEKNDLQPKKSPYLGRYHPKPSQDRKVFIESFSGSMKSGRMKASIREVEETEK